MSFEQAQRNYNLKRFEIKLMLNWKGLNITKSRAFVAEALDRHFGGR